MRKSSRKDVKVRAFFVFVVTLLLGFAVLVFSYHAFFERAHVSMIALGLFALGLGFGAAAGWWSWVLRHWKAFLWANFAAGMMILFPFIVISMGAAIILLPLVLVWVGMNLLGLKLTQRIRAKNQTESTPCI
jgi:hypothetical protein